MIRQSSSAYPPDCGCQHHPGIAGPRLAGYIDASGNYQEGSNPDPTYGGQLTQAPDAVLGPIMTNGQYFGVTGANPGSTTPIFPQGAPPATTLNSILQSDKWSLALFGVIAYIAYDVLFNLIPTTKGRR